MSNNTNARVHRIMGCGHVMQFLTVEELAAFLRIGRSKAYELCHQPDFPAIRIGRTIRISREAFLAWLAQYGSFHNLGGHATGETIRGHANRAQSIM